MTGLDEVAWARRRVDGDLNRTRAVLRGDPGRDTLAGLDGDRERGAERRLVLVGHLPQPELVAAFLSQAQADEPAGMGDHEVDRVGRRELGGNREVALVLAVLVVDDDDEAALADLLDRLLDGREGACGAGLDCHRHGRIVPGEQLFHILGKDVGLEVDVVARRQPAEGRDLQRVRDQRDLEARFIDRRHRQGDPVNGDRALLDAVPEQLGRRLDPHTNAVRRGRHGCNRAGAVDVALHLVAAEWITGAQCRLDVDPVAERLHARRRLRHDVEGEPAG